MHHIVETELPQCLYVFSPSLPSGSFPSFLLHTGFEIHLSHCRPRDKEEPSLIIPLLPLSQNKPQWQPLSLTPVFLLTNYMAPL